MSRDLLPLIRRALEGQYEVDREIGRGGAARVFAARDRSGRPVALKVLHPELQVSTTADRFLREIQLATRLDHPNIARLLDSGEQDWLVWYVMAYVPGPTLRAALDRVRQLPVSDTLRIAGELLDAIAHAHGHGIVHRDVKPENILIGPEGAVLVDFGIARAIDASAADRLTRSGIAVGTSHYMSPEQIRGTREVDHRSDLYSLACVLYECLAGRPPFGGRSDLQIVHYHLAERPADVRSLRADVPAALAVALQRALAKDPADRWPSANAMREAIAGSRV